MSESIRGPHEAWAETRSIRPSTLTGASAGTHTSMRTFDILPDAVRSEDFFHTPAGAHPPWREGVRARYQRTMTMCNIQPGQSFRRFMAMIVSDPMFDRAVLLAVLINAVLAGFVADHLARDSDWSQSNHPFLRTLEIMLFSVFVVEMCMRLLVYRSAFFRGPAMRWNLFDLFVVFLQLIEEALLTFTEHRNFLLGRCLRALRALKVLRIARYNDDVKILIGCCLQSVRSFWGAGLCLLLLVYMMSIFTISVSSMDGGDGLGQEQIEYWYGSLPLTMLTLMQSLTGGIDWGDATRPLLDHVAPPLGILSICWTLISIIVLMNVITGIFVSTAMTQASRAALDKDISKAEDLFMQLDVDRDSTLRMCDFDDFVNGPRAENFFSTQRVQKRDAELLFRLLDKDGSGDICIREFISGCVQMKEQVRLVDVLYLTHHLDSLFEEMKAHICRREHPRCSLAGNISAVPSADV